MSARPFRILTGRDEVTVECPCGMTVCGEGEVIDNFIKKHRKHTDGKIVDASQSASKNIHDMIQRFQIDSSATSQLLNILTAINQRIDQLESKIRTLNL